MNSITIGGHLGGDPERREFKNSRTGEEEAIAVLSVALARLLTGVDLCEARRNAAEAP